MNKEYVQQYVQLEKEHWWFVIRRKILFNFLSKQLIVKPQNILNIGAAGGESRPGSKAQPRRPGSEKTQKVV